MPKRAAMAATTVATLETTEDQKEKEFIYSELLEVEFSTEFLDSKF